MGQNHSKLLASNRKGHVYSPPLVPPPRIVAMVPVRSSSTVSLPPFVGREHLPGIQEHASNGVADEQHHGGDKVDTSVADESVAVSHNAGSNKRIGPPFRIHEDPGQHSLGLEVRCRCAEFEEAARARAAAGSDGDGRNSVQSEDLRSPLRRNPVRTRIDEATGETVIIWDDEDDVAPSGDNENHHGDVRPDDSTRASTPDIFRQSYHQQDNPSFTLRSPTPIYDEEVANAAIPDHVSVTDTSSERRITQLGTLFDSFDLSGASTHDPDAGDGHQLEPAPTVVRHRGPRHAGTERRGWCLPCLGRGGAEAAEME
ncbi:MAG: hypothetical protein M1819_006988 [Sarea resinae]|nr:MAG: hypothetical protein M1819_006988 [Sarea resinae]